MFFPDKAERGICFAWLPKRVPGGTVWLDYVHFRYQEGTGWGDGGGYIYARWIPERRYYAGERRRFIDDN